jgi:hypothetical protein
MRDFTTKVEISNTTTGWMAMVHITSSGQLGTSEEVRSKLREELVRITAVLESSLK